MSKSQQLNLETAKIKGRNFSHIQTHNDILFNYEMIFWGQSRGSQGQ